MKKSSLPVLAAIAALSLCAAPVQAAPAYYFVPVSALNDPSGTSPSPATAGVVDSGIAYTAGQKVILTASGIWTAGYGGSPLPRNYVYGPGGVGGGFANTPIVPNCKLGALIAYIDGSTAMHCSSNGNENWVAETSGNLKFFFNDAPGDYGDNAGVIDVLVKATTAH